MNGMLKSAIIFAALLPLLAVNTVWADTGSGYQLSGSENVPPPPGPYNGYPPQSYPPVQPVPWPAGPGWIPPPRTYYGPLARQPVAAMPAATGSAAVRTAVEAKPAIADDQQVHSVQTEDIEAKQDSSGPEAGEKQAVQDTEPVQSTAVQVSSGIQLPELTNQIETLQRAVSKQKTELAEFQQRTARQQSEIDELLKAVAVRDQELAALKEELQTATMALRIAKSETAASSEKAGDFAALKQSCEAQFIELTDKLQNEKIATKMKSEELAETEGKVSDLADKLSICGTVLAVTKAELASLQAKAEPQQENTLAAAQVEEANDSRQVSGGQGAASHAPAGAELALMAPPAPAAEAQAVIEKPREAVTENSGSEQQTEQKDASADDVAQPREAVPASPAETGVAPSTTADARAVEPVAAEEATSVDEEAAVAEQQATQEDLRTATGKEAQEAVEDELVAIPANTRINDSDRDGVNDSVDLCPDSDPDASVGSTGCAVDQPIALDGVAFPYDSHELTRPARTVLDHVAEILMQHPEMKLEVAGHTDPQGDPAYNQWLSEVRAQAVKDYLVSKGLPAENLTAHGYGSDQPIAANDSREGLRKNRRVELRRRE